MTAPTTTAPVAALLEQGRAALRCIETARQADERARQAMDGRKAAAHWDALVNVARPHLAGVEEFVTWEPPEGWSYRSPEYEFVVTVPGCTAVSVRFGGGYGSKEEWRLEKWPVRHHGETPQPWKVTTLRVWDGEDDVTVCDDPNGVLADTLPLALALAEREERRRPTLEAEAASKTAAKVAQQQRWQQQRETREAGKTPAQRLLDALRKYVQSVTPEEG